MNTIVCIVTVLVLSTAATALRHPHFEPERRQRVAVDMHVNNIDNADDMEQEVQLEDSLVEDCLVKIIKPTIPCVMAGQQKWNVGPVAIRTDINSKATCCAIWHMTDCMTKSAKLHCTKDEEVVFAEHMDVLTERRSIHNCSAFPYHTNDCTIAVQSVDRVHSKRQMTVVDNSDDNLIRESSDDDNDVQGNDVQGDDNEMADFKNVMSKLKRELEKEVNGKESNAVIKPDMSVFDKEDQDVDVMRVLDDRALLAKKLLDRVDRITVTRMVIDLHPVNNKQKPRIHRGGYIRRYEPKDESDEQ